LIFQDHLSFGYGDLRIAVFLAASLVVCAVHKRINAVNGLG
jgi:hypothetical protein